MSSILFCEEESYLKGWSLKKSLPKIYLLHIYARSGGTLLNRCVSCHDDLVVLSEVNSLGVGWGDLLEGSPVSVKSQLFEWYDIEIADGDYITQVQEAFKQVATLKKSLLIRDWSFLSYNKNDHYKNIPPMKLNNYQELSSVFNVVPLVMFRNVFDVWLSMGKPEMKSFFNAYERYVDDILSLDCKILFYEDLVSGPENFLSNLFEFLNVKVDLSVQQKFSKNWNVAGDTQNRSSSSGNRGTNLETIKKLDRKNITLLEFLKIMKFKKFYSVNLKMGYEEVTFYSSAYYNGKSLLKVVFNTIEKAVINLLVGKYERNN